MAAVAVGLFRVPRVIIYWGHVFILFAVALHTDRPFCSRFWKARLPVVGVAISGLRIGLLGLNITSEARRSVAELIGFVTD